MTTIFLAMPDGLVVVKRSNGGWQVDRWLAGMPAQCVAVDPSLPEWAYCGPLEKNLWCSHDGDGTWQPVGRGVSGPRVYGPRQRLRREPRCRGYLAASRRRYPFQLPLGSGY